MSAVAYVPGSAHGKRLGHYIVNDSGAYDDELDLMLRLEAQSACIYAYHNVSVAECRRIAMLRWEFIWLHEGDRGDGPYRYGHEGAGVEFHVQPEDIFPVYKAWHGVESVGAGAPRQRVHLRSTNNRKYYFSACNCLDHCLSQTTLECSCVSSLNFWAWSYPDNIVPWNSLSGGPVQQGIDVYAPEKWMLPDPDNDPTDAEFDVCYNNVPNTPCQCTTQSKKLDPWVDPQRQEELNWCWAAASQNLIRNMVGDEPDQEDIVRQGWCSGSQTECICVLYPGEWWEVRPCCNMSTPRSYIESAAGWPCAQRAVWSAYGIRERRFSLGRIPFTNITTEINAGKPVYLIWEWSFLESYHAMLITGYACDPTEAIFVYNIDGGSGGRTPGEWVDYEIIDEHFGGYWFATSVFW